MIILLDTNILVPLSDTASPWHEVCRQAIPRLIVRQDTLCLCAQVMIEYWAVATRPASVNGLGFTPEEAEMDLCDFERTLEWLPEPPDIAGRWRALANEHAVRGKQAHDTRLVALMMAHGVAHLLTLNGGDFGRFEGVHCLSPDQVP